MQGKWLIREVRRDLSTAAQGCRKNVTLWVALSVFRAYGATLDQPSDVGMIPGKSGNRSGANVIKTAVAHVGEVEPAIDNGQGGAGGAHSVELRMFVGVTLNHLVRGLEGMEERILRSRAERMVVDVTHGFDREAAGLLSAFVSAHAVSNNGEATLAKEFLAGVGFPIEVRIFIIAAQAADVAKTRNFDSGL